MKLGLYPARIILKIANKRNVSRRKIIIKPMVGLSDQRVPASPRWATADSDIRLDYPQRTLIVQCFLGPFDVGSAHESARPSRRLMSLPP
jgi:hypothetical protein